MKEAYDDTFLARWIDNQLSDSELDEFKTHPDYLLYKRIATKSKELSTPDFDKNQLFSRIQKEVNAPKKNKVKPLYKVASIAVAASVAIVFGLLYLYNAPTIHTTDFGEQMAVHLPDGSEVMLNSKSEISFSERNWVISRNVELKGEAFFKVEKGSNFTVNTRTGNVSVLGTQFNVTTNDDLIEVSCYEGKVKVESQEKEVFLTKGKAFRNIDGVSEEWEFKNTEPSWKNGESSFTSISLKYVIKAIENQYSVNISAKGVNLDNKFTGAFTHEDLNIALETVFRPLQIKATILEKNKIILVEE
ncbi:FecR family protein [Tenacibaculum sp. MEBiC06402]|uniref:FecR family protein n=1 Tax=unclassified Tenacibaculum TaxID=2635139 RepID=UPI003B9B00BB